jgi:hypothetical protein
MLIHGLPKRFWVVTKPSPVSQMCDICFPCTFEQLMLQVRGGLKEEEVVGIFADEDEAHMTAMELLGEFPIRPQDSLFADVVVHVQAVPNTQDISAKELARAAVEAVGNALQRAEKEGYQHRLRDRVSLGTSVVVELTNMMPVIG